MKWAVEMPAQPGVYWLRERGFEPTVVEVYENALSGLVVSEIMRPVSDYSGSSWHGPIARLNDEPQPSSELAAAQMDAQRLRNALREAVKDMRARAAWIGPMSALWRDVFEYEMLINGRGDTVFDWDGPDGPKSRNRFPTTPPSEE